jgi:hypothetical protein
MGQMANGRWQMAKKRQIADGKGSIQFKMKNEK